MAQRTVCLCDGKYIGIESIYTVIDRRQINIPEKLKELRQRSRRNELYCPCGCGANLILVAGDKNLREQHFRLKDGTGNLECHAVTEGTASIHSKIVLKCWLDEKLKAPDIETRVPIHAVEDTKRKYEFTFLSREKHLALSYWHDRANISAEKIRILDGNSQGICMIYVADDRNGGNEGQYPEGMMKIQDRQGFCLLLSVAGPEYEKASLKAAFYARNADELWEETVFAGDALKCFDIDDEEGVLYQGEPLGKLQKKARQSFEKAQQEVQDRRKRERQERELRQKQEAQRLARERQQYLEEMEKKQAEQQKKLEEQKERLRLKMEQDEREARLREEKFRKSIEAGLEQQESPVIDALGKRWIKCKYCGKIARDEEFVSYGGKGQVNLGICKECLNNSDIQKKMTAGIPDGKAESLVCPRCGGALKEKNGFYGKFLGCSNFPMCRYTRNIRK